MIDFIFTAEFDILKGSLIRNSFPPLQKDSFDEALLSSYMIPDGCHKREYDNNVFKYSFKSISILQDLAKKINGREIKIQMFRYSPSQKKWEPFFKEKSTDVLIMIEKSALKSLKFVKSDGLPVFELEMHADLQFTRLDENFYSLYSKEGVSFGLTFQNKDVIAELSEYFSFFDSQNSQSSLKTNFFFYNLVKNKKDDNIKRGSLIRAISLCSKELNRLQCFDSILRHYLNIYSNLDISNNLNKLESLLHELFIGINEIIPSIPKMHLSLNPDELLEIPMDLEENLEKMSFLYKTANSKPLKIDVDTSFCKNYTEPSLLEFIKKFGEKTMLIYNSILNEEKILFIGYDCSIEETCTFVNSCISLTSPINISERVFPYEHLLNLDFLQKEGYIAGVSNPIFNSRKQWWGLCCNITNGSIVDNRSKSMKPKSSKYNDEMCEIKANGLDNEFIGEILKKTRDNEITEMEARMYFYEYTRNFLDLCSNSSNLIDFERDDKSYLEMIEWKFCNFRKTKTYEKILMAKELERQNLSRIFGDKFLNVVKTVNMFAEIKSWNDYELLLIYSTLIDCFNNSNEEGKAIFLKMIFSKKYTLEALSAGFFSSSEDVLKTALRCFEKVEGLKEGGKILKKFSYYILFVYQNLKNKYMSLKV